MATKLLGEVGDDAMNPKPMKKLSLKPGRDFSHSPKFFCSPLKLITVLWLSKHTTRTDPAICFYLHLALWMMFCTMQTPQNSPYAHVGHVFSQILSGYVFSTFFVGARNNFPRTRGQVVLIK